MPNFINRQEAADYDYDVNRWRQAAEKYNANVTTYNKQVDAYNSFANVLKPYFGTRNPPSQENLDRLSALRPNQSLVNNKPDEKDKPVAPSFTTQQMADISKSHSPMVDVAMAESKRSPIASLPGRSDGDTGLISRALKGFK